VKPPPFSYHAPKSVEETLSLLASLENVRILAGGQSLLPMLNMRFSLPDHVIDINRIADLSGISIAGDTIRIGAMTRQRDLEFSPVIAEHLPLMAEAMTYVGHRQTRNRGTIGGSLCHLDPAAELPCVAAAYDAEIEVMSSAGVRKIAFADFPLGYLMPALEAEELVSSIHVPIWSGDSGAAFVEFARRHGDFAIVSAAALLQLDEAGRISRSSLALGGVGSAPLRMAEVEAFLIGKEADAEVLKQAGDLCSEIAVEDDPYTPAPYRRHLCGVQARKALALAWQRALEAKAKRKSTS
jgi:carbon-monoxide dehydrogenase medium subunit